MTVAGAQAGAGLRGRRVLWAALAAVVFLAAWWALGHGFFAHGRILDTPFYQGYGLRSGRRGPLPRLLARLPARGLSGVRRSDLRGAPDRNHRLQPLVRPAHARLRPRLPRLRAARAAAGAGDRLVALSPVLLGPLVLSRYDLWPAALVAAAVAAFGADRHRLAWLALGLAFAAKLYALVLLPLAVVWTLRRRGSGAVARARDLRPWRSSRCSCRSRCSPRTGSGGACGTRPRGRSRSRASRPRSSPRSVTRRRSCRRTRSRSPATTGSKTLTTAAELAALVALWIAFARGPAETGRFFRYAAACVCAFVAFGKVLSPQYLIWLVPLVALVRGPSGLAAAALLASSWRRPSSGSPRRATRGM